MSNQHVVLPGFPGIITIFFGKVVSKGKKKCDDGHYKYGEAEVENSFVIL